MKYGLSLMACVSISVCLSGCAYTPDEETPLWVYSSAGAAVGGMAGGYVGSGVGATVASVGGAAVGGLLGYEGGLAIEGKPLRDECQKAFILALNSNTHEPILWEGIDKDGQNKTKGSVVANKPFLNGSGSTCRTLHQTLQRDTRKAQETYVACRSEGGQWDIQRNGK